MNVEEKCVHRFKLRDFSGRIFCAICFEVKAVDNETHRVYLNIGIKSLATALNKISVGFYPGDPTTHIHQKCIPKIIAAADDFVVVEVCMDMPYPYLEKSWLDEFGYRGFN